MLLDVVLHDSIVPMGIYANVCILREAESHDVTEDTVNIREAGNTVYDMIGLYVIQPLTIVYLRVGRLWRGQKSKIADNVVYIYNDKATMLLHITSNDGF